MFPVCALFSTRGVFPNFSCLLYLNLLPISFASTPEKFPASAFSISLVSFFRFRNPIDVSCFHSFKKRGEFPIPSFPRSPFLILVLFLTPIFYLFVSLFYKYLSPSDSKVKLFTSESAEIFWCNVYLPSVVWNLLKILFDHYGTHSITVLYLWFSVSMVN
jgi:hypothetical protein